MLKLSQASGLTGRHEDTIRRIIKKLLKTDPQAPEKIKQEQTVRGFHYLIDKEYLLKHLQPLQQHQHLNKDTQQPPQQGPHQPTYAELLETKDKTIAILEKQLAIKDEQIREFQDRDRETNFLLKRYHEQPLIEAPKGEGEGEAEREKARNTNTPEKPKPRQLHKTTRQTKKTEKIQPQKRSFWAFLTGKS